MRINSNIDVIDGAFQKTHGELQAASADVENELSKIVVGLCLKIHKALGPGLLESVYEEVLCHELGKTGLRFSRQQGIVLTYDNTRMDIGLYADVVIEDKLIIELKSVESLADNDSKVLLTHLRLNHKKLGLLINFNVEAIADGIKRIVNNN